MKADPFKISDYILKFLRNELSEGEKEYLEAWIASSEGNKKLFQEFVNIDYYNKKRELYNRFDEKKDFGQIISQIHQNKTKNRFIYFIGYAAALIALTLGVVFWGREDIPTDKPENFISQEIQSGEAKVILQTSDGTIFDLSKEEVEVINQDGVEVQKENNTLAYNQKNKSSSDRKEEKYNTLYVPKGGEYNLILSDGTKVWLNSDSRIKYPVRFLGGKREIYITGEAYFDVTHNPAQPFIVNTGATKVEVLGTSFNLRAYDDEDILQATLVEGRVAVKNNDKEYIISPSEQLTYNKVTEENRVEKVDVLIYTSWKDGVLIFDRQQLEYILKDISRWYSVDFHFEDESLKNYVFSGRLKKYENANHLLELFEKTGNISFDVSATQIYVRKQKE